MAGAVDISDAEVPFRRVHEDWPPPPQVDATFKHIIIISSIVIVIVVIISICSCS